MNAPNRVSNSPDSAQASTPLASALYRCGYRVNVPFYTPGHKKGQGISERQQQLFGRATFKVDLPELPELDNLFEPEGVILAAQKLAAEAFGADQTFFLANGSTCGIEAAIMATCGPGDKLILPRDVHSSAIAGLILSGATPVYINPTYSDRWQISLGISPNSLEQALSQHPEAKAVLLVSPSYYGICSNLSAIAQITHAHHIPLIIDEAHAPHFAFHPALPKTALQAGADIAVQSAHKVLSAFTQAALLHVQGDRINRSYLKQCLQLTQSTSPSYLLLGSLDTARHQMATCGQALMEQTLALADKAYESISKLNGIRILPVGRADQHSLAGDRTRLTIDLRALNITGFEADDILHTQFSVTAELPTLRHLMFIVSLGNTPDDITQLIAALKQLQQQHLRSQQGPPPTAEFSLFTPPQHQSKNPAFTPRQAFFASKQPLPIDLAIDHICAETICPYPPGIPALLPGELVSVDAIAYLQAILRAGGTLTGCSDPSLKTIMVAQRPTC